MHLNLLKVGHKWPSRFINIFGPKGCGKTHLANILSSKINSVIISSKKLMKILLINLKLKSV